MQLEKAILNRGKIYGNDIQGIRYQRNLSRAARGGNDLPDRQGLCRYFNRAIEKDDITIVVGQDMRTSSPSLADNIIRGITEQGVNVVDIGLASTPTFYYAVTNLGLDGGMQVSASHNPKEYNGVKIVRRKALPVGYDNGTDLIENKDILHL